ncbi:alpha/beta hydrolase family protein [Brevibacillus choshinensis]|uniref:Alpha/beta hydrolase n=1 Tax=Brevibacillus choshinensis TaxID=54911 RepID=A0ABX7FX30_BRECH|nr:alpha/beta hydrolase family protein [Brevibacillus choshinensis]QRG70341.1 alpha/beta hydrolase [Brevibacillus choshinensis]
MRIVFEDQTFSFELLRALSYAPYGGADIGECLTTAYRIKEGDFDSWYREWYRTAERIHSRAEQNKRCGQWMSARENYLRAHNYYRTAEFFLHGDPDDPRMMETWGKSRSAFREAIKRMDFIVEEVQIPYEGTFLPGYFYRLDDSPRPTLLIHGGFDSTGEELYFGGAAAALQRGYHCLTFEGPGQGAVIREQRIPFRHDWERVVTPVVDYMLARPEVDPLRLALMGISLGGYLSPRAAAFEHRLAACIANDGLFSNQFGEMGKKLHRGKPEDLQDTQYVEAFIRSLMDKSTNVRWAIENGMFTYQAASIHDLIEKTQPYTLEGVAQKIQCPTLVCEAEADHFFAGQPKMLYDALTCPKTFMLFSSEESAEEHCQFGALVHFHQRLFEWLDEVMAVVRE